MCRVNSATLRACEIDFGSFSFFPNATFAWGPYIAKKADIDVFKMKVPSQTKRLELAVSDDLSNTHLVLPKNGFGQMEKAFSGFLAFTNHDPLPVRRWARGTIIE